MPKGYWGKILLCNLTDEKIEVRRHDESFYRKYLGGKGIALYYLLNMVPEGVDPLGPENVLVFAPSVITGAPIGGLGRHTAAAKSPLTGGYGEGEAGGFFGAELKRAGFDAVVVAGKSSHPVYIWIHDGQAEIRPAEHLWGKTVGLTEEEIRRELNDNQIRVACIGPAGEKLVRFACIINDKRDAIGRGGLGAVMGSKNLKAIAVRGTIRPEFADGEKLISIGKWIASQVDANPLSWSLKRFGTAAVLAPLHHGGMLPTRNFQSGSFEGWERLSAEVYEKTLVTGNWGCYACPVRCKRNVEVQALREEGKPIDYGGPEYETIASFGSNLGIDDLSKIVVAHRLCNALGLDTISCGVTIAFAMEAYERGLIGKEDTDGIELKFGNASIVPDLIRSIAYRKGFGNVLAEGSKRAAEILGKGLGKYAMQVKGQELAMHDPRGKVGVGLGYAVASHGADHMVAAHDTMFLKTDSRPLKEMSSLGLNKPVDPHGLGPDKVRHFVYLETLWDAMKCLTVCFFVFAPRGITPITKLVEIVRAVTGWDFSAWELMKAGERASALSRIFNKRQGVESSADTLPDRMFETITGVTSHPGIGREDLNRAKQLYYAMRGWDGNGVPTKAKLVELDLDFTA